MLRRQALLDDRNIGKGKRRSGAGTVGRASRSSGMWDEPFFFSFAGVLCEVGCGVHFRNETGEEEDVYPQCGVHERCMENWC
jgi:hypothetical protein